MSGMSQLPQLPRGFAFWLIATAQTLLLFASSAPSPLYPVYQAAWGLSAIMLTAVFAVYAIALLVVGGISDHVGRRKVLGASLVVEVVSMLLFITADGVGPLLVTRVIQGLATGAATGAASSALLDLKPPDRSRLGPLVNSLVPLVGLALGALGSGLLVEYAPAPKTLVYALLLVVFVLGALVVPLLPETSPRKPGAATSLVPHLAVPRRVRPLFLTVAPCLFAVWAVGGLYMSLGPSIAVNTLHMSGHLVGGLVIFAMTGSGALGSLLRRNRPPRSTMTLGFVAFLVGIATTLGALAIPSPTLFFIGVVITGYGFGTGFLGAFQTIAPPAGPDERAGLVASIYVVGYLGFSVPAVVAGLAVQKYGLDTTTEVYSIAVMVLAVVACAGLLVQGAGRSPRSPRRPPARHAACATRRRGADADHRELGAGQDDRLDSAVRRTDDGDVGLRFE